MKVQDIIDRLTVLGLDETEAAVYVQLSIMGASKASDLATALKLHRTEAYRTLQTLVQRGFATATLGRPSKFEAAPPEKLFAEILAAQEARSQSIKKAQDEIAPALSTLRSQPSEGVAKNTFKVLQGRREIYAVMERMIRDAQVEVRTLTTHPGAVSMTDMTGILDLAMKRAQEGIEFEIAMATTPESRARLAPLLEVPSAQFRHVEARGIMRYVVVDGRELLMWVVNDPSTRLGTEGDVALWTDAADYVQTEMFHFDAIWREARDLRQILVAEGALQDARHVRP